MKIDRSEIQTELNRQDIESLNNMMLCAKWIVGQFESIHCDSIARIFQKAVDDAYSWIQTMVADGSAPDQCAEPIHIRETEMLHALLVRYASISNPETRKGILKKMMSAAEDRAKR